MRRRLLSLLTLLSLLLCVAMVALWVRSHWATEGLILGHSRHAFQWFYGRSGLYCAHLSGFTVPVQSQRASMAPGDFAGVPPAREWYKLGFNAASLSIHPGSGYTSFKGIVVPFWLPITTFAGLPALRLLRRLRPQHGSGHGFEVERGKEARQE